MHHRASRSAVIDIGSNSVRLVVYAGHRRIPSTIFNEKILAGLGSELAITGNIGTESFDRAITALKRFKALCDEFRTDSVDVIATAAVRDANNGHEFVQAVQDIGLDISIIEGKEEAYYSALGVMSAFPHSDGIMADLGGGSLEIAQIYDSEVIQKVSLPMGVLRVTEWCAEGYEKLNTVFQKYLRDLEWKEIEAPPPLFLVGGSWRALARIDMDYRNYPLRVVDHYIISNENALEMNDLLDETYDNEHCHNLGISSLRIKTLPQAAMLMRVVADNFRVNEGHISAFGLREGILFSKLDEEDRKLDPLLIATDEFARTQRRFHEKKADLNRWLSPLFQDDRKNLSRIRQAFCNLGDVAWMANPDFRAEWALEIGLHGSWTAITGAERDILGQALFTCFGGGARIYPKGGKLASEEDMKRAIAWGLTARLAQRLSGGREESLSKTKLLLDGDMLTLACDEDYKNLCGEAVIKRLRQLASFVKKDSQIIVL